MITRKWLTLTHAARLSCAILTFTDNFARSPTTHFVTEIRRSAQKCHPRYQPHLCLPPTIGPPVGSWGGGGKGSLCPPISCPFKYKSCLHFFTYYVFRSLILLFLDYYCINLLLPCCLFLYSLLMPSLFSLLLLTTATYKSKCWENCS